MSEKEHEQATRSDVLPYAKGGERAGFFTVHRRGQGKWTRLGTAIGSAIVIVGCAIFIYSDVRANMRIDEKTALIAAG